MFKTNSRFDLPYLSVGVNHLIRVRNQPYNSSTFKMKFLPLSFVLSCSLFLLPIVSTLPANTSPNPALQARDYWLGEMQFCVVSGNHCTLVTYWNPNIVDIPIYIFDYWCNLVGFNPGADPGALAGGFGVASQLPFYVVVTIPPTINDDGFIQNQGQVGNNAPTFWYDSKFYDPTHGKGSITYKLDGWDGFASVMPFAC